MYKPLAYWFMPLKKCVFFKFEKDEYDVIIAWCSFAWQNLYTQYNIHILTCTHMYRCTEYFYQTWKTPIHYMFEWMIVMILSGTPHHTLHTLIRTVVCMHVCMRITPAAKKNWVTETSAYCTKLFLEMIFALKLNG